MRFKSITGSLACLQECKFQQINFRFYKQYRFFEIGEF